MSFYVLKAYLLTCILGLTKMKEILFNLALLDAINYCKEHKIDCSGTHLVKYPRRFTYALVKDENGRAILTTTFYKSSVPHHHVHN